MVVACLIFVIRIYTFLNSQVLDACVCVYAVLFQQHMAHENPNKITLVTATPVSTDFLPTYVYILAFSSVVEYEGSISQQA